MGAPFVESLPREELSVEGTMFFFMSSYYLYKYDLSYAELFDPEPPPDDLFGVDLSFL